MDSTELFKQEAEKKFTNPEKFAQDIEEILKSDSDHTYISAIVEYCEKHNLDIESIVKLIPKPLKEKIRNDAERLNFITKQVRGRLRFDEPV